MGSRAIAAFAPALAMFLATAARCCRLTLSPVPTGAETTYMPSALRTTRRSIDSTIALPRRRLIGSVPRIRALRHEHRLPPGIRPGPPTAPHGDRFQVGDLRVRRHLPQMVERRPPDRH